MFLSPLLSFLFLPLTLDLFKSNDKLTFFYLQNRIFINKVVDLEQQVIKEFHQSFLQSLLLLVVQNPFLLFQPNYVKNSVLFQEFDLVLLLVNHLLHHHINNNSNMNWQIFLKMHHQLPLPQNQNTLLGGKRNNKN